jgi:hypothetical protein
MEKGVQGPAQDCGEVEVMSIKFPVGMSLSEVETFLKRHGWTDWSSYKRHGVKHKPGIRHLENKRTRSLIELQTKGSSFKRVYVSSYDANQAEVDDLILWSERLEKKYDKARHRAAQAAWSRRTPRLR